MNHACAANKAEAESWKNHVGHLIDDTKPSTTALESEPVSETDVSQVWWPVPLIGVRAVWEQRSTRHLCPLFLIPNASSSTLIDHIVICT